MMRVMDDVSLALGDARIETLEHGFALILESWRGFDRARSYQPPIAQHIRTLLDEGLPEAGVGPHAALDEVSDYLGEFGTWLHVTSEHHQMALVASGAPHFHHLALDYVDFGALRTLFDNLAQHGRWLSWGPVRHGIAQNMCGYVRITEEPLHVECYCDMEQLEPEHEPRTFPDDRFSSNTWGPLPPRSYFRFDRSAVEAEREGLEALGKGLPG